MEEANLNQPIRTALVRLPPVPHSLLFFPYHLSAVAIMKTLSMLLAACAAFVSAAALPAAELVTPAGNSTLAVRGGTASQTGTNNGFYYSFWTSGSMYMTYSNGAGGAYMVDWQANGDFTAGKGWNPGSARCVSPAPHT
jgi:hypothetical protein